MIKVEIKYDNSIHLPNKLNTLRFECIEFIKPFEIPKQITQIMFLKCSFKFPIYKIPDNITTFYCNKCNLYTCPELPKELEMLSINNNNITKLPILPKTLIYIWCLDNPMDELPISVLQCNRLRGIYFRKEEYLSSSIIAPYPSVEYEKEIIAKRIISKYVINIKKRIFRRNIAGNKLNRLFNWIYWSPDSQFRQNKLINEYNSLFNK